MASYIPDLTKDNISLYLMPVGFMIALAPRFFAANTYKQATNGKDLLRNLNPRDFTAIVREDKAIDQKTKMRIARAEAAQANGFENLGLFAAAVTAASLARVDPSIVNGLTIGYLDVYLSRGVGMLMALFVKAGQKLSNSIL
ncbi:hypothetical protein EJ03DRAFT_372859 [Teratosphaeria nubilosa]|uniref:Uncharacterized protein n=1 Tax=Teratosphaeria nubilosa TaxID=161662 RepID=A0A6G1LEZ7_9PEZI|nr:hypothetical protein EJ03DRAFT_372859 [Teratosphaeria nubilosa]